MLIGNIAFLGFNDPRIYKRGVENVIKFQSSVKVFKYKYYIFFGLNNEIFRWDDIICISIKTTLFKYFLLSIIIYKLKRKNITYVHSHNYIMSCFLIYKTDIFTVHDAIFYQRKSNQEWNYFIFYFVEKFCYLRTNYFHFISRFSYNNSLLSKRKFKKFGKIIFNTSLLEILAFKDFSCDFNNNEINLFTVRGIQPRTRIDLLIDFADFCSNYDFNNKKIHIYIAGKGIYLDRFKKEIVDRNITNITFLGYISDEMICNYYKQCDMVIVPCEYAEGFGLPIIEGYLFNKPVIASNRCAIPEIINSKVFLFENTPESIFKTFLKVKTLPYSFKEFYDNNYSLKKIINEYTNFYNFILNGK
jgi:glycosyltransferase involved in cell wall biosynthesis